MATPLQLLPYFKVLGLVSSGFLSGYSFSATHLGVEAALLNPSTSSLLDQFDVLFNTGKFAAVPMVLTATISYGAVAGINYLEGQPFIPYAVSSALVASFLAFTGIVMIPGINRLLDMRKQEVGEKGDKEARALVKTWGQQNYVRAALGFTATAIAAWGIVTPGL